MLIIPENKLHKGIDLCHQNVTRFLEDADLLYKNQSYGHALSLAILALEEHGKKLILITLKKKLTRMDKELWSILFRRHSDKVAVTFRIFTETLEEKPPEDELEEVYRNIPKIDLMKQRGLYIDYFKDDWHSPFENDIKKAAIKLLPWIRNVISKTDECAKF